MVQVRHVPEGLVAELKSRVAAQSLSLSDYLRQRLEEFAGGTLVERGSGPAHRAARADAQGLPDGLTSHGLRHGAPSGSKCLMFRVATVIDADCATAAIRASSNGACSGTR